MAWADSVPRDPGNRARIDEVKRLVNATGRNDGRISVTAGSEPGFHERYDALKARLDRY